ncbi:structure-specific endonuclease subunit SLX1 homolog isoform X2 [Contarinia nasturtii]|uniref:structure-specific endonuclease subunit SLX1 homolog isoform X2 n=1 Tax=Contarinia nasturtii TaxID=265458 RepID=UPI0012D45C45|nr:structure-specific endonuclease subunit SLX1 homolog isoform X2 [Contarinia nasturtii]
MYTNVDYRRIDNFVLPTSVQHQQTMDNNPIQEDKGYFYGVYLLCSQSDNPKYRNKNYIGFTVNPNRRIIQHNRGNMFGGAKKTSDKGPWEMVLIVHGFPNNISALRFEWAWQQPKESRRLRHLDELKRRKPGESFFDLNFRILTEMLRTPPWNRLALTVRWLSKEFARDFPVTKLPPSHMLIRQGDIVLKKAKKPSCPMDDFASQSPVKCIICDRFVSAVERVSCSNSGCSLNCHLICLGQRFLEPGEYVPISGSCPKCHQIQLWSDVVRKFKGYSDAIVLAADDEHDI